MTPLLEVRDLSVSFANEQGTVRAVDRLSFTLAPREVLAVVGESGAGKTVAALALVRLLPRSAVIEGHVLLDGLDLLALPARGLRRVRGNQIAFVFQEPATALDPVLTVGNQIGEVLRVRRGLTRQETRARAVELLRLVHVPAPGQRLGDYPHQLSGGTRQRVLIALALASDPRILIADEPTTALDATVQAGILDLLRETRDRLGTAIVVITHDLGVVAEIADRVLVVHGGRAAEEAPVLDLFARPRHPYTVALLSATRGL